jgi:hypothetical protein
VIVASALMAVVGLPQMAGADTTTTTTATPVDPGTVLTNTVNEVLADVTALLAELDPFQTSLLAEISTVEKDLAPYESEAGLSPTEIEAIAAAVLVEVGPSFSDTCSAIASLEKNLPTSVLGIPLSLAQALGLTGPEVALVTSYLDNLLASETRTLVAGLAPSELSLLQVNWDTTYYPTTGAPIVRTTQGYVGVPSLLDVDGNPGLDLCTDLSISTAGKITEQVVKMPLAATSLPVDVSAVLPSLGNIGLGYSTKGSSAPQSWTSVIGGATGGGTLGINNTTVAPGPSLTEQLALGSAGSINDTWSPVPATTSTGFGSVTGGFAIPNQVSSASDYTFNIALGSSLSVNANLDELEPTSTPSTLDLTLPGAGLDSSFSGGGSTSTSFSSSINLGSESFSMGVKPLPTSFDSCSDLLAIVCSDANSALGYVHATSAGTSPASTTAPVVSTVSPATGSNLGGTSETITGTGFSTASGGTVIDFGSTPATAVTCSSTTTCTATAPAEAAGTLASIVAKVGTVTSPAATGPTYNYLLTGLSSMHFVSSSVATATQSILVPTPTVTALSTTSGPSIGGTSVTLTGTGFSTAAGGTIIDFGPNTAGNVTCSSTTSCTATAPAGNVGPVPVTATVNGATTPSASAAAYTYSASTGTPVTFPAPSGPDCSASDASQYAQVTGTDVYQDYEIGTGLNGHAWLDTGGTPVSGCSNGVDFVATYPTGTTAGGSSPAGRLGSFTGLGLLPNSLTRTGAITCPTGTSFVFGTRVVTSLLCPTPPTLKTAPAITPSTPVYVGGTETSTAGAFTPTDMTLTTAYQWQHCTTATTPVCSNVASTTNTYSPTNADIGDTLQAIITATNTDGSIKVTTAPTGVVSLPPAPTLVTAPTISDLSRTGTLGAPGDTLSTTNGKWNNAPAGYAYTWDDCVASVCTPIANATGPTYTVASTDEGDSIESVVTASNIGGFLSSASSNTFVVPTAPVNTVAPSIIDSGSNATGQPVLQGDSLSANVGTWTPSNGNNVYSYVWQDCTSPTSCDPIANATSSTYTAQTGDIGYSIDVVVTATNVTGNASVSSAATGTVQANSLALQSEKDVPDGIVRASAASSDGTVYVGGSFDTVGPPVGGAGSIPVSSTTGQGVTNAADATGGSINAIIGDGSGGYFLGGSFTSVQNTPCLALAHITSAGVLDPAYCNVISSGQVNALDLAGATPLLAVGGAFTIGSDKNLVFITPGANPGISFSASGDPNAAVNAITDDTKFAAAETAAGTATVASFFVGGSFTDLVTLASPPVSTVEGHLAKFTTALTSGAVTTATWPAYVGGTGATVNAINASLGCENDAKTPTVPACSLLIDQIIVGGSFATATSGANGTAMTHLNAAQFGGGVAAALATWEPDPNGPVTSIATVVAPTNTTGTYSHTSGTTTTTYNTVASNTSVYLGGTFTTIGTSTGTTTSPVVTVSNAAEFGLTGQVAGFLLVPLFASTNEPSSASTTAYASPSASWTPGFNGQVNTLTVSGGSVYAGGAFTSVQIGSSGSVRHRLASISPAGSALTLSSWDPNAGNTVKALSTDGTNFYAGGSFLVLNGVTRDNAAEFAGPAGSPSDDVTTWNPNVNGSVDAVAVDSGGNIYLGGSFTSVDGTARSNLAAVTAGATQALLPWNATTNGTVDALTVDPNSGIVYFGGSFTQVDGNVESNLGAVDGTVGLQSWSPATGTDGPVDAVLLSNGLLYVGGQFANVVDGSLVTEVAGNLAAVNSTTGVLDATWAPGTNGPVDTLATAGSQIYLGGTFTAVDGNSANYLASVDATDGFLSTWAPLVDGPVLALTSTISTLYAGGSFAQVDGSTRSGLAGISLGDGSVTSFDPGSINGPVDAVARTSDGTLTAGGAFTVIAGQLTGGFANY